MQVSSTYRYAKISPFKVREVTRAIQGLPVSAALDLVSFSPKKAALFIAKTLKSAVANAENNANLRVDGLVVKEATVGEGPTQKRMMARARGSGSRILKRSSHIRIILTDEIEIKTREKRNAQKKKSKKTGGRKTDSKRAQKSEAKAEDTSESETGAEEVMPETSSEETESETDSEKAKPKAKK
jgi:large subunit ribosomal protein L22